MNALTTAIAGMVELARHMASAASSEAAGIADTEIRGAVMAAARAKLVDDITGLVAATGPAVRQALMDAAIGAFDTAIAVAATKSRFTGNVIDLATWKARAA